MDTLNTFDASKQVIKETNKLTLTNPTAQSFSSNDVNFNPSKAIDGDTASVFCLQGDEVDGWWRADISKGQTTVTEVRVFSSNDANT